MAKAVTRKGSTIEIESGPLQEHVMVNFYVVGYEEWLLNGFEFGAKSIEQCIVVRQGKEEQDLKEIKSFLRTLDVIGVDTETTGEDKRSGLDPWREGSKLLLLQLGNEDKVFIIQPDLVPFFKDILEDKYILHLGQNLVYDFKYLLVKYNIHLNNLYDTMLAEQLLTAGRNGIKLGLGELARRYAPFRLISKEVRHDFIHFKERGEKISKDMAYYAARDIVLLFPIMREQKPLLAKWQLETVAQDEFNVLSVTGSMELNGVNIDRDTLKLTLTYWESRQIELEKEILDNYDQEIRKKGKAALSLIPGIQQVFDLGSPAQKLAALRTLDFDIDDVKRETLEVFDHPITKGLAEYSNVMKITSTYGENLLKRVNPLTGHLHPEFNQMGSGDSLIGKGTTATGRFSSDFQQMPKPENRYAIVKDEKELSDIKELFRDVWEQYQEEAVTA